MLSWAGAAHDAWPEPSIPVENDAGYDPAGDCGEQVVSLIVADPMVAATRLTEVGGAIVNFRISIVVIAETLAAHPGAIARIKSGSPVIALGRLPDVPAIVDVVAIVVGVVPPCASRVSRHCWRRLR